MYARVIESNELRAQRRQVESAIAKAQRGGPLSLHDALTAIASRGQGVTAAGQRVHELSNLTTEAYGPGNGMLRLPIEFFARDLVIGTSTAGGHTVATGPRNGAADVVEILRPVSLLARLGATLFAGISGHGNLSLPATSSNSTATWVGEGTAANVSDPAFTSGVALSPKTVSVQVTFSRKLTKSSGVDIDAFVRAHLLRSVMSEIDRAALAGDGTSNSPVGVLNDTGVTLLALGANGSALTYANVVSLERSAALANAENLALVTTPKVRAAQRVLSDGVGSGAKTWTDNDTVAGLPAHVSTAMPSNLVKGSSGAVCSSAIVGDFAQLIVGIWGGLDIIVHPWAVNGDTKVTVLADVAIALRQPAAFSVVRDALAA